MKKTFSLNSALLIGSTLIASLIGGVLFTKPVAAACSPSGTTYGTATVKLSVSTGGTYKLWTRMNAPDANNNSYLLELDGKECFVVGNTTIMTNAWTWVDYQNGKTASKIIATLTAGTHTIKAIGSEPGVKIDRIFAVADQNCTPARFGDNCMILADTTKPITSLTAPDDLSTVKGNVTIKANATDANGIDRLEFYLDDKLKYTDTSRPYEYTWDTTQVIDGDHTIIAKSFDAAGNNSFDARSVTVKNVVVQQPVPPSDIKADAPEPTKVILSWQPGTNQIAGVKYRIIRNNIALATIEGTSYTDTSVIANKKYNYFVVAVGKDNTTSPLPSSPTVVKTPPLPVKEVTPPTRPPKPKVEKAPEGNQINITWDPSSDPAGIESYEVYRSENNSPPTQIATVDNLSYGDSTVEEEKEYTYEIVAKDGTETKNTSEPSEESTAVTLPSVPVNKQSSVTKGTIKSTSGRPLSGVRVTVWVNGKRYMATTNWKGRYVINGLPAGTYEIKVKAIAYQSESFTTKLNAGKAKWLDATLSR